MSSVLKNDTLIETPEDVSGVLSLCNVLVKDNKDSTIGGGGRARGQQYDAREMAEEQGWVARMVHLFRSDDLQTQFDVRHRHELSNMPASTNCTQAFFGRGGQDPVYLPASHLFRDQASKEVQSKGFDGKRID